MGYSEDWYCFAAITIDNTKVGDTRVIAVYLSEGNLPDMMLDADGPFPAKVDGGDIRFSSDVAGASPLEFHVVEFTLNNDPALASANIWVRLSVSSVADTVFYMWWRNPDANALAAGDTYGQYNCWSDPGWRWMCDDGEDATVDNRDFATGNISFVTGKIDDCAEFNEDENAQFTFLANQIRMYWCSWVYVDSAADLNDAIIYCPPFRIFIGDFGATYKLVFECNWSTVVGQWREDAVLNLDTWYHIAVAYNGDNVVNDPAWAINGAQPAQTELLTPEGVIAAGSTGGSLASVNGATALAGKLDEIYLQVGQYFVAATLLKWETTKYNNQGDPANFCAASAGEVSRRTLLRV